MTIKEQHHRKSYSIFSNHRKKQFAMYSKKASEFIHPLSIYPMPHPVGTVEGIFLESLLYGNNIRGGGIAPLAAILTSTVKHHF